MSEKPVKLPADYAVLLADIKQRVRHAQTRAVLAVNAELIRLYWEIGALIDSRQQKEGWGAGVIPRLARDLHNELPEEKGFSERNIKRMLAFYREYPHLEFVPQAVAQIESEPKGPQAAALFPADLIQSIPWGHHAELIAKIKDPAARRWYMEASLANGWSRNILVMQIETAAHNRQGRATTNFAKRLPPPDSDMATQVFKDPYLFDFLGTAGPRREKELEQGLMDHLQKFLIELGQGFAFVGRQVHLELGDQDFYLDLLFYHLKLRRYVVIELKARSFQPGDGAQLGMYMTAVNRLLNHPDDKPALGLLLVREKNQLLVEYALGGSTQPISEADWDTQLTRALPDDLSASLPSIEEIERELGTDDLAEAGGAGV